LLDTRKTIDDYLQQSSWRIQENANTAYSYSGMVGYVANYVTSDYALANIYTPEIEEAHRDTMIHLHDLSGGMACYCFGMDLEQLLNRGLDDIDGPPKHFSSALSQMMNLIFLVSQEIAGACAFNSVDTLLAPYAYKDKLTYAQIKQHIQEFIYSINIKGRIGYQSPFHNAQFDITVPKRKQGAYAVVGGEALDVKYDDLHWQMESITRAFLETMMESKRVLTFPIINIGITKDFNWENKLAETIFESIGKTGQPTINNYVNSDYDPDAIKSMCCFDGSQEVLVKQYGYKPVILPFSEVYDRFHKNNTLPVFHNGGWNKARVIKIKTNSNKMYRVVTMNNKQLLVTDNHLHPTLDGLKRTDELNTSDFLLSSTMEYDNPYDNKSYATGVLIGAYLGDGCQSKDGVTFSLNHEKAAILLPYLEEALQVNKIERPIHKYIKDKLVSVRIFGTELPNLISQFVEGDYSYEKGIMPDVFRANSIFKRGILFGYYNTDGGNSNRIYSVSERLIRDIDALCTTLGIVTSLNVDNRTGQTVTFSDGHSMTHNYPLHCIRMYDLQGKRGYDGIFRIINNQFGIRVKEIIEIPCPEYVYCFEMADQTEPYFTLPNGIITHNCSLKLDVKQIIKQVGGQFGAADNSGSIGVVSLNLPLYGYLSGGNPDILYAYIDKYMELAWESLKRKRRFVEDRMANGMYPMLHRFVDDFRHFFNTIGVIGMNEMLLNMGMPNIADSKSKAFCMEVISHMNEVISEFQVRDKDFYGKNQGLIGNVELVPGEGLVHRFAKHLKTKYPDSIVANGTDSMYITRGCWLPANESYPLMFAAKHQEDLQDLFSGGANFQYHLGEPIFDYRATKSIVRKLVINTKLPFISISPVIEVCPVCGRTQTVDGWCEHDLNPFEVQELKNKGIEVKEQGVMANDEG